MEARLGNVFLETGWFESQYAGAIGGEVTRGADEVEIINAEGQQLTLLILLARSLSV